MSNQTKHTPTLAELRVGDYVWLESKNYNGKVNRRLIQLTAVSKGRLYVCVPTATLYGAQHGKLYIDDWRYGFSTDTGTAFHYKGQTMVVASTKEVAEVLESAKKQKKVEDAKRSVDSAGDSVTRGFQSFALTIAESEREDFFHPCNRDLWVAEFCEWLREKQRRSAEVRASND